MNFELVLFEATVIAGVIALADILYFAPRRKLKTPEKAMPLIMDYARSFFPVLLIVFFFRSFFWEPFRIPSGSLEPTLLTGDFILVNKFDYGVRLPVIHCKIHDIHSPKRGDIIVFRWPPNPSYDFIKRVIGVPGDHISYINKILYINNQPVPQTYLSETITKTEWGSERVVNEKQEDLLGIKHKIYVSTMKVDHDYRDIVVPADSYFVMGDNRDDSADSRYWGFVSNRDIIGKGSLVWMSWGGLKQGIRWSRLGWVIH
ncbi:MAG: signal peptidase I [Gammaproteobacteria bacterium RIFCSPHIGHO2_12_FULL_42_10]|nr:MAG: signal peptidase I [Gammaproteobacteria bacterium RIFCSPHIGHO2_12_FULL_42_10]